MLADGMDLRGGTSRIVTIADPQAASLGVDFSGHARRDPHALARLAKQAAEGGLHVAVAGTLPLRDAASAHHALDRHQPGKLVLTS